MTKFRMSVLGVVLCLAVICAGKELERSEEEFPPYNFQDHLDIDNFLKLAQEFRDEPTTKATCEDIGKTKCAESFKDCVNQNDEDYICKGCIEDYVQKSETDEECVPKTCDETATTECNDLHKVCNYVKGGSHVCGDCLPDYMKNEDGAEVTCVAKRCENNATAECGSLNKVCTNKVGDAGIECGNCVPDFIKSGDGDDATCVAKRCDNNAKQECETQHKECTNKAGDAGIECGDCISNFMKSDDGDGTTCVAKRCNNNATQECVNLNRVCIDKEGDAGIECGGCQPDFMTSGDRDDLTCIAKRCDNNATQECDNLNRECKNKAGVAGIECGDCLPDFMKSGDGDNAACVAKRCENKAKAECDKLNKVCINKEGGVGIKCGDCQPNFLKNGEGEGATCLPKTCDNTGNAECEPKHRVCVNKEKTGFECTDCKPDYMKKGEGAEAVCVAKTCENIGNAECEAKHRVCTTKEKAGFECGDCKPDFMKKGDGAQEICEAKSCGNIGTTECDKLSKKCKDKTGGGYECDSCKDGFVKDGEGKCVKETCENSGNTKCDVLHKKCKNKEGGGYDCTDCKEEFVKKDGNCLPEACVDNSDCKHNGTCSDKLCSCITGFFGDNCEKITECETGKYKDCKSDKGECAFDDKQVEVVCTCDSDKELDTDHNYCRKKCDKDENCGNGKCNAKKFCECKAGYIGDTCEIIEDCIEKDKVCEAVGAVCHLNETSLKGYCVCKDKNYVYKDGNCKTAKWCYPNPCKGGKCYFENGIGSCTCSSDQYFDYEEGECKKINPCLLLSTPCDQNKKCDSNDGKCKCMPGFKAEGEKCIPNACSSLPCFAGATCTEGDKPNVVKCTCKENEFYKAKCLDGSCFLPEQNCTKCPSGMKATNGVCEYEENKKCDTDCGFGWCIKAADGKDNCVCKNDQYVEKKSGKCVLKASSCASGKIDTKNPLKCNCTTENDMYKMSSNEITCERKSCADEDVQRKCQALNARCVDSWKTTKKAYECKCHAGFRPHPKTGVCTDACGIAESTSECSTNKQTCFLTNEINVSECQCSPAFTFNDQRKRCEPSAQEQDVILYNLPVKRNEYLRDGSVDYIRLNKEVIDAMEKIFSKEEVAFARLYKYKSSNDVLLCDVWIQLQKSVPQNIVHRWKNQQFKQNDTLLLPPALVLNSEKMDEVKDEPMSFCSNEVKLAQCGRYAGCKGKECTCSGGFKVIESTKIKYGEFLAVHCEDIDECTEGTSGCTENTTCMNTVGSFYCKCNPGFKKSEGPTDGENTKPCIDLCTPNPCYKGKCDKKNNTIDCTCDPGYGGSFCNRADANFKKASKNTVVVGAVLGTLLGVVVLLFVFYILRQRKNSYSEDFTPAPRIDNAEMTDRRPMRGVSNRAYQ